MRSRRSSPPSANRSRRRTGRAPRRSGWSSNGRRPKSRSGCSDMTHAVVTRRTLLAAIALAPLPLISRAQDGVGLTLAFIPQENPEKLLGDIETIAAWLSERIDAPVEGFVTFDHAAAVEALRNG